MSADDAELDAEGLADPATLVEEWGLIVVGPQAISAIASPTTGADRLACVMAR
jgi:hypothetical protein